MAIEDDFLELMPDFVTLNPQASRDLFTKVTHDNAGVQVRCRVVYQNRVYRTAAGSEEAERGRVYLFGVPDFDAETGKVTLPDGSTPVVLGVTRQTDENGLHHSVVHFG